MYHLLRIYMKKAAMRKKRRIARKRAQTCSSSSKSGSQSSSPAKLGLGSSSVVEPPPSTSRPLLSCSSKFELRPCSSSVASKSIAFCGKDRDYKYYWFKADLEESLGKTEKRKRGRRSHVRNHCAQNLEPYSKVTISRFATCAALDSTLYCIGGKYRSRGRDADTARIVRRVDFGLGESEWKRDGQMINRRYYPCIEALDGKLYVFGGLYKNQSPWAEVFDPRLNRWKALPRPPSKIRKSLWTVAFVNSKKILVAGDRQAQYLYDVKTGSWEYCPPVLSGHSLGAPVAVENTLYWLDDFYVLCAYDIDQRKFFRGTIKGLENEESFIKHNSLLLHLGGQIFCVVWCHIEDDFTFFHFTKIRVYKETNLPETTNSKGVLTAYFQSCQCHRVHGWMFLLNAQLLSTT